MVRRIVGVLVRLGTGQISEQDFRKLLSGEYDAALDVAAWTAPASGLFLEHVRYPESHELVGKPETRGHKARGYGPTVR
jgi:tRNA U38,U39,U40 pseudouridine synthase TruA